MNGFGGVGGTHKTLDFDQPLPWDMLGRTQSPMLPDRVPILSAESRNGSSLLSHFNSNLYMIGADNCTIHSSNSNSNRVQLYGRAGALVLDGGKGELVNASKIMTTPSEILQAKAAAASRSHSEAERRRRERINKHLATLRNLLPSTTKTDKASLLQEVIDHLKDLKRHASEIEKLISVPSDVDEVRVEEVVSDEVDMEEEKVSVSSSSSSNSVATTMPRGKRKRLLITVSLCCEDRPDLLSDLSKTLCSLRLKAIKADISTLDGRIRNVFVMTKSGDSLDNDTESLFLRRIQEALQSVIERSTSSNQHFLLSNKRFVPFLHLQTAKEGTANHEPIEEVNVIDQ